MDISRINWFGQWRMLHMASAVTSSHENTPALHNEEKDERRTMLYACRHSYRAGYTERSFSGDRTDGRQRS
jgi:hypothetical protein